MSLETAQKNVAALMAFYAIHLSDQADRYTRSNWPALHIEKLNKNKTKK